MTLVGEGRGGKGSSFTETGRKVVPPTRHGFEENDGPNNNGGPEDARGGESFHWLACREKRRLWIARAHFLPPRESQCACIESPMRLP